MFVYFSTERFQSDSSNYKTKKDAIQVLNAMDAIKDIFRRRKEKGGGGAESIRVQSKTTKVEGKTQKR
jgi:hypothetical protein